MPRVFYARIDDCTTTRKFARQTTVWGWMLALLVVVAGVGGCGTTKLQNATEQLVLSDAVDRSIAQIDFRPLAGHTVFFDTTYLKTVKNDSFVNADYVISGMRQQIMAAGCLIQETINDAEIVIEGRIGTLGMDDHRLTYGVPENNSLGAAASFISPAPSMPSIPEIAVARRESREGASKVAAFAYDRASRQAVWQSGLSRANSTARDTWVLGVGPFRQGTIRRETKFADGRLLKFRRKELPPPPLVDINGVPPVNFATSNLFPLSAPVVGPFDGVELSGPAIAAASDSTGSPENATPIATKPNDAKKQ